MNSPQQPNDTDAYEWGEIAALLVLCFRNMDANLRPHASFEEQLRAAIPLSEGNAHFQRSIAAIAAFHEQRPELFLNLHLAVRILLEALQEADLGAGIRWSTCNWITQSKITTLNRL